MNEHRQALIELLDEILHHLQKEEIEFYPNPENFLEAIRLHNSELFEAAEDVLIACEMLTNLMNDQQLKSRAKELWKEQYLLLKEKSDHATDDLKNIAANLGLDLSPSIEKLKDTCI